MSPIMIFALAQSADLMSFNKLGAALTPFESVVFGTYVFG